LYSVTLRQKQAARSAPGAAGQGSWSTGEGLGLGDTAGEGLGLGDTAGEGLGDTAGEGLGDTAGEGDAAAWH